jgi:hypothetical protein
MKLDFAGRKTKKGSIIQIQKCFNKFLGISRSFEKISGVFRHFQQFLEISGDLKNH